LFFFPDQHLGYNTGIKYGLSPDDMIIWDFFKEQGGLTSDQIEKAKVILWKGHCHVHTNFKSEHVDEIREKHPGIKIVVHPECSHDVVTKADAAGSTSFIVKYVESQPPGTAIAIGTEINLITRLAHKHPELKIMELSGQTCPVCANMYRTTVNDLAYCIENLDKIPPITVPDETRKYAIIALERMLQVH
jgi:quinolinate synthase